MIQEAGAPVKHGNPKFEHLTLSARVYWVLAYGRSGSAGINGSTLTQQPWSLARELGTTVKRVVAIEEELEAVGAVSIRRVPFGRLLDTISNIEDGKRHGYDDFAPACIVEDRVRVMEEIHGGPPIEAPSSAPEWMGDDL